MDGQISSVQRHSLNDPPARSTLIKPNKPVKCSGQSVFGRGRVKYPAGRRRTNTAQSAVKSASSP